MVLRGEPHAAVRVLLLPFSKASRDGGELRLGADGWYPALTNRAAVLIGHTDQGVPGSIRRRPARPEALQHCVGPRCRRAKGRRRGELLHVLRHRLQLCSPRECG